MSPLVSVILPTFNRAHCLPAAMVSVLGQSYGHLELIIVDDASTQDIESVVRAVGDRRVRYVRRDANGGAAAARNTGLKLAGGAYIAFQDSDDLWLPEKLKQQVALLSGLPESIGAVTGGKILYGRDAAFSYGAGKVVYAPAHEGRLRLEEDQVGRLLSENRLSVQNALFRRNCMAEADWFDPCLRANEDWEFAVRLAQRTTIFENGEPVVLGFVSPDSISSSGRREMVGIVRILRKNKAALARRRRQRAALLISLSKGLYSARKPRWARRYLLSGLNDHPAHALVVAGSLWRRLVKSLRAFTFVRTRAAMERPI